MKFTKLMLCLLGLLLTSVAWGQEVTGTIVGTVKDPSGAVVPNATVTAINIDKNIAVRSVKSGPSGEFSIPLLPIGHYSLSAEASGFKKFVQTGIVLNVNDKLTYNLPLEVGSNTQEVTVEATANQVNLQTPQAAGLISGTQIRQLALNNRNYEQLVALVPGVSSNSDADQLYVGAFAPQGTNIVTFSMNGGRREENNWLVDGTDNVDRGSNLTLLSFPSVDAIAEVNVIRGQYDPEYGRAAGGQINVITRSGTSSLHGGVYEFFRNDVLTANSYFNKRSGVKRPPLRYNNFGWNLGGPVYIPKLYERKDKTFFFFSQEFRRVITYANPHAEVPLPGMLTGTFAHPVCVAFDATGACTATGTTIPTIDPTAAAYITDIFSKYPAPNFATATDPFGFTSTTRGIFNFREEMLKIDHVFSQKFTLSGKILRDSIPTREAGGLFTGLALDNVGTTETNSPGHNYTLRGTITLGTLLIEPGYGYSYGAIVSNPVGLVRLSASPNVAAAVKLPFATTLGRVPNISFSGFGTGASSFGPYRDFNRNHTLFTNVSKLHNNHTVKIGAIYYHYQKTENAGSGNQGQFTFNSAGLPTGTGTFDFEQAWANFLLGRASQFTQNSIDMFPDIRDNQFEYYIQDTWRVRSNFTLVYGLRHSFFRQPTDAKGLLSNFDPAAWDPAKAPCVLPNGNLDISPGPNGQPVSACNPNYSPLNGYIYAHPPAGGTKSPFGEKVSNEFNRAIAPRIGIAWDPFGTGKTSIRSGFGLFFDNGLEFGNPEINIFNDPGFQTALTVQNTTFANPTGGTLKFSAAPPTLNSRVPLKYSSPYVKQWSLDIQHELAPGWVFDTGYYGNSGTHLPGYIDNNQPPVDAYLNCTAATPCMSGANAIVITPPIGNGNTPQLNALRPFIGYSGGYGFETIYTSNYNAWQSQLRKQFRGNSEVTVSYTWSHGLTTDNADRSTGNVIPQVSSDLRNNYGPTVADRRHVLTGSFVWELPFLRDQHGVVGHVLGGWEVSGIQTFQTGLPLTVSANQLIDPTGAGCLGPSPCVIRANQMGDPNSGAPHSFDNGWFNAAAFTDPTATQTTVATERPGAVRGPGFWRTDLSLFKNIKMTEHLGGQFRLETFNTFNHTNPVCCSSLTTSSASYNLIRSTRDPRIVQLGMKLEF